MTFEEFQATGRDSDHIGREPDICDEALYDAVGRVYLDCLYIEHWIDDRFGYAPPDGPTWMLTIENRQWIGDRDELEKILYDWAKGEYFD